MAVKRLEISPDERPVNDAPPLPEGFLGKLKREWSDSGCQVPAAVGETRDKIQETVKVSTEDEEVEAMRKLAMSGEMSSHDIGTQRYDVAMRVEKGEISKELGSRLLDVLVNARYYDRDL